MAEYQNLCLGCMHPLPVGTQVCPNCSRNNNEVQPSPYLPKRSILCEKYLIGLVKETATDCVTYAAFDISRQCPVFVCEFLPENLAVRNDGTHELRPRVGYEAMFGACFQSFVSLWQTLHTLNGIPALPNVIEVFGLNSTVYAVYDSFESITLDEYFTATEKQLDWERAKKVFSPIIVALIQLNSRGIVHGRVSPSTILVGADGRLRLSGFSIPQAKSNVIELRSDCAPGYSPLELSDRRLSICANTDVYSIMAVMYTALTGSKVQPAAERAVSDLMVIPSEIAQKLPKDAIELIVSALQVHPENRLSSMQALYDSLYRESSEHSAAVLPVMPVKGDAETSEAMTKKSAPRELNAENKKESGAVALTFKVFITLIIVLSMAFVTAYSTFLYKYIDVGFLDDALAAVSFLPMNGERRNEKQAETTATAQTTNTDAIYVTVPNFKILTYREIFDNTAFKRNFDIEYKFETSETVEKNSVIAQSVSPGESVEQGTKIVVTVSSGKPKVVLKDVIGKEYDEAYNILTEDGFVVEKVVRKNTGAMKVGTVCNMSLVAGLEFEKGTTVTLTVWGEIY